MGILKQVAVFECHGTKRKVYLENLELISELNLTPCYCRCMRWNEIYSDKLSFLGYLANMITVIVLLFSNRGLKSRLTVGILKSNTHVDFINFYSFYYSPEWKMEIPFAFFIFTN